MLRISRLFLLFLGLIACSFRQDDSTDSGLSVLVIKLRYSSMGMSGYGGRLVLRNLETEMAYVSNFKRGLNPYVIIENLPPGTYSVAELDVIYGPNIMAINDEALFNTIKIEGPRIYYMGSYMVKKIPPMLKLNVRITEQKPEDEEGIYKQVRKKSEHWADLKIYDELPLLLNEITNVEIRG